MDSTKYRFIPPSKLQTAQRMPTTNPDKAIESPPHSQFESVTVNGHRQQPIAAKQASSGSTNESIHVGCKVLKPNVSNSQLPRREDRKPVCPSGSQNEHSLISKLSSHISELQEKQQGYKRTIHDLQQANSHLRDKLARDRQTIDAQSQGLQKMRQKLHHYDTCKKSKNHEYTLIIQSLKQVIQSQITKIQQLELDKMSSIDPAVYKQAHFSESYSSYEESPTPLNKRASRYEASNGVIPEDDNESSSSQGKFQWDQGQFQCDEGQWEYSEEPSRAGDTPQL